MNEFLDARTTVTVWRIGQCAHGKPGTAAFLLRRLHSVLDRVWTRTVIGAELPRSVPAGPGIRLPHAGRGVIIFPSATIGAGVTLYHQVTIGIRDVPPAPVIEDGTFIGCGAKILGSIHVGAGSKIGANAVVLADVPPGATVVGVPAHVVHHEPAVDAAQ